MEQRGPSGCFRPQWGGGLFTPPALLFGPDCHLYVTATNLPNPGVFRYNGTTGAFIDQFASFGAMGGPIHFAFGPDGNLYVVTQGAANGVLRFNGTTGAFIDNFVFPGSGGLSNPFGLAFTPALPPVVCTPPTNRCPLARASGESSCDLAGDLPHLGEPDLYAGQAPGALDTPPRGDASVILAHQLIAAKLNLAHGSNPAPISSTITDADNLLSQFGSNRLP